MFTDRKEDLVRRRTIRAIKKHSWTLIKQIFISFGVALFWYWIFWRHGIRMHHSDADIYLTGVLFIAGAAWALKATQTLEVVWGQAQKMEAAVKRADIDTIIDLKDDHIPLLVPFYLSVLALVIEGILMLLPYHKMIDGSAAVFIVSLIFTFYGAVIYELEDPTEGGWVRNEILKHCPELLDMDVEQEFARRWREQRAVLSSALGRTAGENVGSRVEDCC